MEQAENRQRQLMRLLSPSPASSLLHCHLHVGLRQMPPSWHGRCVTGNGEQGSTLCVRAPELPWAGAAG